MRSLQADFPRWLAGHDRWPRQVGWRGSFVPRHGPRREGLVDNSIATSSVVRACRRCEPVEYFFFFFFVFQPDGWRKKTEKCTVAARREKTIGSFVFNG